MRRAIAALVFALTTIVAVPPAAQAAPKADTFAVVRQDVTWTDTTRGTNANQATGAPAKRTRTLDVMVLRPDAPGRFPLVVFVHGVTASGPAYEALLRTWAESGYVVAAPTEPLTSGAGGWSNIGDYQNQPGDVRFVIDKMLRVFRSKVDAEHIAVSGHSLGAITTIGSVYSSCCTDSRVDAAIELSGIQLPFPNGTFDAMPPVPLLAVHGAADQIVPVSGSDNLYAAAAKPAHYLRFKTAGHVDLLAGAPGDVLHRTVIAFLARYLKNDAKAMDGVRADVVASGIATYKQKVVAITRSKSRPWAAAA